METKKIAFNNVEDKDDTGIDFNISFPTQCPNCPSNDLSRIRKGDYIKNEDGTYNLGLRLYCKQCHGLFYATQDEYKGGAATLALPAKVNKVFGSK